ncbi:peptidoglycan DD-metalloendopeptidase family protein [Haematospirillum sp. H1815]|uniref:peptidoglycan DD-metalloendopeptidase family protein n=1 Tax=Haematospirillum sp. H1815 TaxID=2723108 RepID=UPI00143B5ED5|nr:peptidoglycan DD-metalloendopeptidase family protein [Haematospirillum sp. H1815]NKD76399.1 peptidoglycan DD-metalloendopeptidase family protein [Haematospirillum sp. H1815]
MSLYDPRKYKQTKLLRAVERVFPERRLVLCQEGRSLRSFRLTTACQAASVFLSVAALGWSVYATWGVRVYSDELEQRYQEIQYSKAAHHALLDEIADQRRQLMDVAAGLDRSHGRAVQLAGETTKSAGKKGRELDDIRREYDLLRETLGAVEQSLASLPDHVPSSVFSLEDVEIQLRQTERERDLALSEREVLRGRVDDLEYRMAEMAENQVALLRRFSGIAGDRAEELHEAMAGTGIDINKLMSLPRNNSGQGGPFVPFDPADTDTQELKNSLVSLNTHVERWNAYQGLVDTLPLGFPVKVKWSLSSPFGVRSDPINGVKAVHQGLDIRAPWRSSVYATGQGTVAFAGWRGRYGRMVEVEHGNGLKTRYGHLSKIVVKKGDRVDRSIVVGLLGNSGRSTGAHLHYEVLVNDVPRNPQKFIRAGAHVFKG